MMDSTRYNQFVAAQQKRRRRRRKQMMALVVALSAMATAKSPLDEPIVKETREQLVVYERLRWEEYLAQHRHNPTIEYHLTMKVKSFHKLASKIWQHLVVDEEMAALRGGAITPEICLYCTLRYLACGKYSDIALYAGISETAFYNVVHRTMYAINAEDSLALKFPTTEGECAVLASGFMECSRGNAIENCVGVLDGYLVRIIAPRRSDTKNPRCYYSGKDKCFGFNCQGVVDSRGRFLHFELAGPGSAHDMNAYRAGTANVPSLESKVNALPGHYCVIGDQAYVSSGNMVALFKHPANQEKANDDFNFYASQLRMKVECSFGRQVNKYDILRKPLMNHFHTVKLILLTIARLHNYGINEKYGYPEEPVELPNAAPARTHRYTGDSLRRGMVWEIVRKGLQRPTV